jgi:aminoglycoside 6'-N-acetyltransferase
MLLMDETLRGKQVVLRRATLEDAPVFQAMLATPEVSRWWTWRDIAADLAKDGKHHQYAITVGPDVVGMISWYEESSHAVRYAGIDIFLDPAFHRRGYGTDALQTLVRWLVTSGGHHRLIIDPHVENTAAIACYTQVGFRPIGIMRQYIRVHEGPWEDALLMDLLASDLPELDK